MRKIQERAVKSAMNEAVAESRGRNAFLFFFFEAAEVVHYVTLSNSSRARRCMRRDLEGRL